MICQSDLCTHLKLKCVGGVQDACNRCCSLGINCVRSQQGVVSTHSTDAFSPVSSSHSTLHDPVSHMSDSHTENFSPIHHETTEAPLLVSPAPSSQLPLVKELKDLIQLYFSSVHRKFLFLQSLFPALSLLHRIRVLCFHSPISLQSTT